MATYTVTTTADAVDPADGRLSLREALALADTDPAADTVVFAPEVQGGRIVLAGSELTVASDVTIDGGLGVTLDANQQSRVLSVLSGTPDNVNDVTLVNLTITGGRANEAGGGITAVGADLHASNVSVSNNSSAGWGGGIFVFPGFQDVGVASIPFGGHLELTNSTVSGNTTTDGRGGGIFAWAANVTACTISGNTCASTVQGGGGISGRWLDLTGCILTENSSASAGGGVFANNLHLSDSSVFNNSCTNEGGGIANYTTTFLRVLSPGSAYLTNATIVNNHAANGGGIWTDRLSATNSTIVQNDAAHIGGGVYVRGDFFESSSANSIIAGNVATDGESDIRAGNFTSNGRNIFGSDVDGAKTGDLQNVPASVLFAGGLAYNDGPTPTIALRDDPSNPALGGANPWDAPATDQRGVARPLPGGTDPDVGAFEHPWLPLDGLEYIASYADLIRALGPNGAAGDAHYRTYGASEGRRVAFDGLEYLASWGDLIRHFGADRDAGATHFITHGFDEGRGTTFDGLQYIASFDDLIAALGAERDAGSTHFIDYGAAEGRTVSFDGLQYIASYGDLIEAFGPNADAGPVHFISHGTAEGRLRDDFDEVQYLANYPDLQAAFGHNPEAATVHYIEHGYAEGRTDQPLPGHAAADFLL